MPSWWEVLGELAGRSGIGVEGGRKEGTQGHLPSSSHVSLPEGGPPGQGRVGQGMSPGVQEKKKWQWSCFWLLGTPWTVARRAPTSMGISRPEQLEWVATPFSRGFSRPEHWSGLPFPSPGDLPNPGIESGSPASQADSLPSEPPGKSKRRDSWKWLNAEALMTYDSTGWASPLSLESAPQPLTSSPQRCHSTVRWEPCKWRAGSSEPEFSRSSSTRSASLDCPITLGAPKKAGQTSSSWPANGRIMWKGRFRDPRLPWGLGKAWASEGCALFAEDVTGPLPHPCSPGSGAWRTVCLSRQDHGRPAGKCALRPLCTPIWPHAWGGGPGWGPGWLGISRPAEDACHYSWRVPSTQPSPAFL